MDKANSPKNIIVLIADSLRYDSVYSQNVGLPYVQAHATTFTEARAGGCWTLPATASIFTGRMPHEHGATEQTRGIYKDIPTLAEHMKAAGYKTYQVTANVATTDIFGLHRGFDEVRRIWKMVDPKFSKLNQFLVLIGKPRLREKLLSKDMLMNKMSEDVESAKTWLQHTYEDIFNQARQIIKENEAKGEKSFIFLNLMETHFPYHIAPTFELSQAGMVGKVREIVTLYHTLNQTFLKKGHLNLSRERLDVLKHRQQMAWKSISAPVDAFCKEMHENTGNLMVFGADHGENFGESGWAYHFSNVTDAGNKVPLFWLDHDTNTPRTIDTPVSTKNLYDTLAKAVGQVTQGASLLDEPERAHTIMSSYWYNNKGQTHANYLYNQMAFLHKDQRFMLRNGEWYAAPFHADYDEPQYIKLPPGVNPIGEFVDDREQQAYYEKVVADFSNFSSKIKFYK